MPCAAPAWERTLAIPAAAYARDSVAPNRSRRSASKRRTRDESRFDRTPARIARPTRRQPVDTGRMTGAIDLGYPFVGRWLVQNSPANRVPSHGTTLFATSYAIDFVPVSASGRTAPVTARTLLRPQSPTLFPGFGRPILAPLEGVVLSAHDTETDHDAYRGLPSVAYALTQPRRAAAGWVALAGNHVLIEHGGVVVALCHLQHGSVHVRQGQRVSIGDPIGRCGNSGNSTEPHVHVQAIDDSSVEQAEAVPLTFRGSLPRNGQVIDTNEGP